MSYREENGQVVLTMSREDYETLLMALGHAAGSSALGDNVGRLYLIGGLLNRLNQGNPNYTPYEVAEKS